MSQLEFRSVPALKKEIIRLVVAAAVQLLFAIWFYAFCCGLVDLGPLSLPYGVKGYEFGGMVCVLTAFLPVRTVWSLNEAVDEAKKHEPMDFDALLPHMAEICRKALREMPSALLVIPVLFLVEWMQAGMLRSIPMAVVYALLMLLDYLLFRRFLGLLQAPPQPQSGAAASGPAKPTLRSSEQMYDLRSLQKSARSFLILGAVEAAAVLVPMLRAGFEFKMITFKPSILPNALTLTACFLLGAEIFLFGWKLYRQAGDLRSDDRKDLLKLQLDGLAEDITSSREKTMMATMIIPVALIADIYRSESAEALPWLALAVVYYLLFELLWRRYKKQLDQVMAEV